MREILLHFWAYNMRYRRLYWSYIASQILFVILSGVLIPLNLRSFIDALSSGADEASTYYILSVIGSLTILNICAAVFADYFITNVAPRVMRDIESDCFDTIHRLSLQYFAGTHVGGIVSKIKRFSIAYNTLDLHITRGLLSSVVQITATMLIVLMISPMLSIIFGIWGIVFIFAVLLAVKLKMKLDVIRVKLDSHASGHLADSITNFLAVKIFSRFGIEKKLYYEAINDVERATRKSWYASIRITVIQSTIVGFVSVLMLVLAFRLYRQGSLSIGTVVLLQTYVFIIGSHFMQLGEQLKSIYRAFADCVEMMDIIRQKPSVTNPVNPESLRMSNGSISVDSISFHYHSGKPVFKNFSLHIPKGQKVGIVGHSGAGKSTLVALLLRFVDVQEGSIHIDGQDIRSVTQDDLRSVISYVPQDTLLFHRTIRENIAYSANNPNEEEIIKASTNAHAHEFVTELPQGYDTVVGERGIKLSGGERQRIAIARAMLRNSPILLLDEATSSLDSVSERLIQRAFDRLIEGRTTIVIAHRLSTIQKMDRIVVLDHGRIVEDGSHHNLIAKKGLYADLWHHQSDGFIGS
jgi:ATP-binding cassette, subfamily B, bacterial